MAICLRQDPFVSNEKAEGAHESLLSILYFSRINLRPTNLRSIACPVHQTRDKAQTVSLILIAHIYLSPVGQ